MAEHYEGQYDDLTVGLDDIGEEGFFEEDDLLKYYSAEKESPLARLKTLVLSIDWDITDEVLRQCNEELVRLRGQWSNEKIYLVYIQALETISKYIYQQKTNAHPNSVKLLPVFFNNFEKIVHDESLDEEQKKEVLLKDVQRFNQLKEQISGVQTIKKNDVLKKLKALVLSIDWEITEEDLKELGNEVFKLEEMFKNDKPKLILLQGLGTLAAYIQHKSGNAHAESFSLLHDFLKALENITRQDLSFEEQKKILFVEVEKFNKFKEIIASTISPAALQKDQEMNEEQGPLSDDIADGEIKPAFAEVNPDDVHGFQEEEEAAEIEYSEVDIEKKLDSFFGKGPEEASEELAAETEIESSVAMPDKEAGDSVEDETESRLASFFDAAVDSDDVPQVDKELALQGVDVETEGDDDSDEEELPLFDGELAPALADNEEQSSFSSERVAGTDGESVEVSSESPEPVFDVAESDDDDEQFEDTSLDFTAALADVENDDSFMASDSDIAPALSAAELDLDETEDDSEFEDQLGIESTLDAFFDEESVEKVVEEDKPEEVDLLKEYFDDPVAESALEGIEQEDSADGDDGLAEDFTIAVAEGDVVVPEDDTEFTEEVLEDALENVFVAAELEEETEAVSSESLMEDEDLVVFDLTESDEGQSDADTLEEADSLEGRLPEGSLMGEEVSDDSELEDVAEVVEEEECLVEFIEVDEETSEGPRADLYEGLRMCVQSLSLEIDEKIINGLMSEINQMRQKMVDQPLGKSFLQLMSTVSQHIGHYQFDSGSGAFELLLSLLDAFEKAMGLPVSEGQELFLVEMYKVLNWQQAVMEEKIAQEKALAVADRKEEQEELFSEGEDELLYAVLEEEIAADEDSSGSESSQKAVSADGMDEIRVELQDLRQTLREEISQLRAELMRKG